MSNPLLSILLPVHPSHIHFLTGMRDTLISQISRLDDIDSVEIIDNVSGKISTGANRNLLLDLANGTYIIYADIDDDIEDCYVEEIIKAISTGVDCVSIFGKISTDGKNEIEWHLSKDNPNSTITRNGKPFYLRTTNHLCPVKRELALLARFPDKSNGEDKVYSDRLNPHLKTEAIIYRPLYHYRYISTGKLY